MLKNAKFNDDLTHRYVLSRLWNDRVSKILFIGLNPSTADSMDNDHTVSRLIHFTRSWGYGGFYICNACPIVSSDPKIMYTRVDEMKNSEYTRMQRANMEYIERYSKFCDTVVFMWGANPVEITMKNWLHRKFKEAQCFGKTRDSSPKHPARLSYETILVPYRDKNKRIIEKLD